MHYSIGTTGLVQSRRLISLRYIELVANFHCQYYFIGAIEISRGSAKDVLVPSEPSAAEARARAGISIFPLDCASYFKYLLLLTTDMLSGYSR